jgi:photosystem II stability/assembly factor-like uncharacterized protein
MWALMIAVAVMVSAPALAQVEHATPGKPFAVDDSYLSQFKWRNIGPNRGGRSIAVAGSAARPNEYYFGAVGGGLWKTTDGGTSWKPVTDGKVDNSAVGGVAVCEANPDVVFFTTGETELRGNIMPGNGVYKSSDGGKTWRSAGLQAVRNFSRVRIDPTDCNHVLVGGFGHYGAPNPERGVYLSRDGGQTWKKTLYRDPNTGAIDISIDPRNPNIIYAALWEAWRKPWGMSSGGPGSGLFKSSDGGEAWTELTHNPGMPAGIDGKIGVSVSPVDDSRVYAIVENANGGVFVSDDAGKTWRKTNDSRDLRQRAFYYTRITADPKIKDRVYVTNVDFFRSDDGGKTFPTKIKPPHGDNHDLWIAPNDNQRMIEANDGGASVSVNGGKSWTSEAYPTAQIYRVTIDHHFPYFACGAQQDNTTICVPSKDWKQMNVLGRQYGFAVGGGESGYVANDPRNPNIYYAGSYGGELTRFDYSNGQERAINVLLDNPMGYSAKDLTERFQWTFPIVFDPNDPGTLYVASQHVWKTTDEGQSWQKISPDLTRNDPATLGPSGGPITLDQSGVETYGTVFALTPSRLERGLIWAGSDDGLVHITRDGGKTWQNVTPRGIPKYLKITTIEDSPTRPGTAFLTGQNYLLDDLHPYVLKTIDYGRHWTNIANGIPADEIAHSIREDTVRPGLLYLGTERGVWMSFNDGQSWQKLQRNLPVTQVADLAVTDHDLVIATHGRSFWVLDNVDTLRQLGSLSGPPAVHLFKPAPAVRRVDPGVMIDYYLPKSPTSLRIDILDSSGRLLRSFAGGLTAEKQKSGAGDGDEEEGGRHKPPPKPSMNRGLNRFTWDMRYPGFVEFPGMILWAGENRGPLAMPGSYQARLTVDGQVQTEPVEIRLDPRIKGISQADLVKQFELASAIRDKVSEANNAVLLIRGVRAQIGPTLQQVSDPASRRAGQQLDAKLAAIEERIYQVNNRSSEDPLNYPIMLNDKLAGLAEVVERADATPTAQDYVVFAELSKRLQAELASMNQVLASDLPAFNMMLGQQHLAPIEKRALPAVEQGTNVQDDAADQGER